MEQNDLRSRLASIDWDKAFDDSIFLDKSDFTLPDGRRIQSELWSEFGYTFLTYRFLKTGLENSSTEEIVDYLNGQGVSIDTKRFPVQDMELLTTEYDPDLYHLTITIAESEE
ncbi:hypothetical protein [Proteiniclasticum sp. QWL-01]|uniref:hypothetical protein n=1 Tax=Proteiniclasticum sp. QWL-01 TaxID=3036945 RepID=UPI00240F8ED6|nr:hypothetical protein [Proteiniclasticum sp. QWL-01]WFF72197.1 hypothetical protein P6M73_13020 [Proteiniclasticum sp. QWL-01]